MLTEFWYRPTFANMLGNRAETMAIVGVGAAQVGLHLLGLPGWACPFKALFGIPCPGCGLTTATDYLLHGQFSNSLHTHAFAPLFLGAFILMGAVLALPKNTSAVLVEKVAWVESKTGLMVWFAAALMIYWFVRLLGFV